MYELGVQHAVGRDIFAGKHIQYLKQSWCNISNFMIISVFGTASGGINSTQPIPA